MWQRNYSRGIKPCSESRVVDPPHFSKDPDPSVHFHADPYPTFHLNADPDPSQHQLCDHRPSTAPL
jgi:hypothetical protein